MSRPRSRFNRTNLTVAAAIVAVLTLTAGAIWLLAPGGDDDGDTAPRTSTSLTDEQRRQRRRASAWSEEARVAVRDLGGVIEPLVTRTDEWLAGELDGEDLRADLETWAGIARQTREQVGELEEFELAPDADRLVELSAELYQAVIAIHQVALDVDDHDLRTQVHLLARRVRTLGDRIYDRGYALVEPYLFREEDPNVTVNLPEEVPIWPELGIAPGPPLAARPPSSGEAPSLREENRPEQSRVDWIAALNLVNPTSGPELAAAIDGGSEEELAATAERLVAAAESLRGEPDPEGDREAGARVRLGLLVHADAARAAQAATFVTAPGTADELRAVARRLALIGGDAVLWVDELPSREPGYAPEDVERP